MQYARILCCLSLIFLVHAGFDWLSNRPQNVGVDVPSGKLASLSFAPFREGFDPIEEIYPIPEHVEQDMGMLVGKTENIRTYSGLGGLEVAPEYARQHGLTMLQGAWLNSGVTDNQKEIDALIQSANANADVVKRVIVGNEVMLRKEMPIERLIDYIRQVKRAVKQPVSYADVWSMYMKYPQLFKEVDFITIHILPYWEDEPIAIDHAPEHLEKIVRQVENEAHGIAPGKSILIGETGWPSAGRQRGEAVPSVVNAAKYIRDMVQVAQRHGFDYNIVEAFNQPWKSKLEGVVGANWGLLSVKREPVFPVTGLVYENPDWLLDFGMATGLLLIIVVARFKALKDLSWGGSLIYLGLAQIFGVCLVTLGDFLWYTSYSHLQRSYTVVLVLVNALLAWGVLQRCHDLLMQRSTEFTLAQWIKRGYLFFLALALYKTLLLSISGRYLSFPLEQFMIPVWGVVGLLLSRGYAQNGVRPRLAAFDELIGLEISTVPWRQLAYALSLGIVAMVVGETYAFMVGADFILAHPGFFEGLPVALEYTFKNQQLVIWLLCLLVLSVPCWSAVRNTAKV